MFDVAIAYIDPGSGSLIIQVIIATLIAIPVFLRSQIARVIGAFRHRSSDAPSVDESAPPD